MSDAKDSKYGYIKKRRYGSSSSSSSSSSSGWVPYKRRKAKYYSLISSKKVSEPKSFKEVLYYGDVELKSGLTATYGAVYITGAMLNNFSALSSAFDTYSIRKYKVDFIPYGQQVFNTASGNGALPSTSGVSPLVSAIDYDDTTVPGSLTQLYEYATVRYSPTGKRQARIVYPKTFTQLYETAVSSGYSAKKNQWIDIAQDDVPHIGLKWGINYPAPGANIKMYQIMVTVWYCCKDQR